MKALLTISVNCGKWLIAKAVLSIPEVKYALKYGKVILKGGTTVSCIAEELLGIKLRISGRVTRRGTVCSFKESNAPHCVIIENNTWQNIDDSFLEMALKLGSKDVFITGANAIDMEGNTAMMAGIPGGGDPGMFIVGLKDKGPKIIIAAGLEKLIPGKISDIIDRVSRKDCDFSMGMAIELIPVHGQVITEVEALKIITGARVTVIGCGGIDGAEGSTIVLVEGEEHTLNKAIDEVIEYSSKTVSGEEQSLRECRPASPDCLHHLSCFYLHKNNLKLNREAK